MLHSHSRHPPSTLNRFIHILCAWVLLFQFAFILTHAAPPPETHRVPMRDGTRLATDVYLPDGPGPWPVILLRFPYNKALGAGFGPEATRRGFAFVAQDTRGRFASEGKNLPFDADGQADGQWDGFDTAEWVAAQSWCNGRIGTWGGSAGAITQYLLAATGQSNVISQHLTVGAPGLFHDTIYRGGIFRKALAEDWIRSTRFDDNALSLWTTNYPFTDYWKDRDIRHRFSHVQAAGLHIGGWFDIFAQATVDAFIGYQTEGAQGARNRQVLIMGPWTHGVLTDKAGDLTFPDAKSTPGNVHDAWNWFARTLNPPNLNIDPLPAVTYYVMGAVDEPGAPGNIWRTAKAWPPVPTEATPLFLRPNRTATFTSPTTTGGLSFSSDPENPVPSIGGYELTIPAGPKDQRPIETRDDILVFTTPPLEKPIEVTGQVMAHIHMASDAPDTDVVVRLCDVYPDGRSFNICEGVLRLRLREGWDREVMMKTDEPVLVTIPLWVTSIVFNKGHSLRVHVASTSSPALEPNLQNGQPPRTGAPRVARNILFTGGAPHGSHLILPIANLP